MYRPRIIPVLLLKGRDLVKTLKFRKPIYLGDPINAVKIFNDMEADELIFLDITATAHKRCIDYHYVREIAEEAYMPFSVGGGISEISDAENLIANGAEKVVVNSSAYDRTELISQIAARFGSQSVIAGIDVRRDIHKGYRAFANNAKKPIRYYLADYIKKMVDYGAGELFIQSVDLDGTMTGYDEELISFVAGLASIPVTACGGASSIDNMANIYKKTHIQGLAAGSLFLFQKSRNSFLINYPSDNEKQTFGE